MCGTASTAILHHTYVNITKHDADVNLGLLARLTPSQKRFWFHRWQHVYLWALYGLLAIKWHLLSDFRNVITGRIGGRRFSRPAGWHLAIFLVGKASFLIMAFGIPALFYPVWVVPSYYGVAALVLRITLSVVFELAYVEHAEVPLPRPDTGRRQRLGHPSGADDRELRPPQRGSGLAPGRLELPDEHHRFASSRVPAGS